MKVRALIIPAVLLLVAIAGYALGRFQGTRSFSEIENASSPAAESPVQSMLGTSNARRGSGGTGEPLPELSEDLGGREIIDTLIAGQAAVSPENMLLAIRKAAEEPDPVKSNLMFAQLLQMLTSENAPGALEALNDLPRSSLTDNQRRLFRFAWGQIDGPAAAEYAAELTGRNGGYAAYSVMSGWASNEPDAAIAWVESIAEEGDRESFYRGIVGGLAKSDPDRATRYALERHAAGDSEADDYISTIAREQFRLGIDTASAWIDKLTVAELKQDAVYRVAREYVDQEPALAAAWVEKFAGMEYGKPAIGEVADEWAERDAASAVDWVAGLPAGETRSNAFSEVFREWTERDAFAAADYLVTMPDGKDRDAAVDALSRRHVRADPEAAVTWAVSIGDESVRLRTLTYTGQQWMRRDPEKAGAWLESSGLPEEVQKKIRNLAPETFISRGGFRYQANERR